MTVRKNAKRDRILDTAEELFALHGYDGVSLRKIATRAGCPNAAMTDAIRALSTLS